MNLSIFKKPTTQRLIIYPIVFIIIGIIIWPQLTVKFFDTGFDLSDTLVDKKEILAGGPVKDGIPALNYPKFISAESVQFLSQTDRVLGMDINGVTKAYPIKIMDHHEIVNDKFGSNAVLISYCPLCGTGMAFDANIDGNTTEFGVSGLLFNSDVLLYDRQTNSLWSQIMSKAISGKFKGKMLKQLNLEHTTWINWKNKHPDTLVLSTKTGHSRNYQLSPYRGYETDKALYFPVQNLDKRYHPKERVLGVKIANKTNVYPFSELAKGHGLLVDTINGTNYTIKFNKKNQTASIFDSKGKELPSTISYWFAWMAFYPDSLVYAPTKSH